MRVPIFELVQHRSVYLRDIIDANGRFREGVMKHAEQSTVRAYHYLVTMENGDTFLVGHGRNPRNSHMEPITCVIGNRENEPLIRE